MLATLAESELIDLPKHCAPLPQMSPGTVRLPFSSMDNICEPLWFFNNNPWGVPSKGASVKLKLFAKNRSPLYEVVERRAPLTYRLPVIVEVAPGVFMVRMPF